MAGRVVVVSMLLVCLGASMAGRSVFIGAGRRLHVTSSRRSRRHHRAASRVAITPRRQCPFPTAALAESFAEEFVEEESFGEESFVAGAAAAANFAEASAYQAS